MSIWKLLDTLGMRHDDEVMEWVTALQVLTPTSHVSRPTIIELISRNWRSKGLRGIRSLRNSMSIENVWTHSENCS